MQLIGLIRDDLLKSAELTGQWENKLRKIERRQYDPRTFIDELKAMVAGLVMSVMADNSGGKVVVADPPAAPQPARRRAPRKAKAPDAPVEGMACPACGKGTVIRGKTAYGCSRWREGCTWRHPFDTPADGDKPAQ